jgi:drug/metabolite transporter (DMT)-like permease
MRLGVKFALITALISGFSIVLNKQFVQSGEPMVFSAVKNLVVAGFLFSIMNYREFFRISKEQLWKLLIIGLVGGCIPFLLFFKGLSMTSAATAGFIHKTLFVWASIFAFLFLKEKVSKKLILSYAVIILGLLVLFRPSLDGGLMILLATVFWGLEQVISKNVLKDLSPRTVGFARMFFGSLMMIAFLTLTGNLSFSGINVQGLFVGAGMLTLYVFTWYTAIKHSKVSEATMILALGQVFTFIFQGFQSLNQFAGTLLIIGGLGLYYSLESGVTIPSKVLRSSS